MRKAPQPPPTPTATLNPHAELNGIKFYFNSKLLPSSELPEIRNPFTDFELDYDFSLERQILCTTKASSERLKNPFFH
jgi:hypothetical protein